MSIRRAPLTSFVNQYLQARRARRATASGRAFERVQRQASDKLTVEAVARTIRGSKA